MRVNYFPRKVEKKVYTPKALLKNHRHVWATLVLSPSRMYSCYIEFYIFSLSYEQLITVF